MAKRILDCAAALPELEIESVELEIPFTSLRPIHPTQLLSKADRLRQRIALEQDFGARISRQADARERYGALHPQAVFLGIRG